MNFAKVFQSKLNLNPESPRNAVDKLVDAGGTRLASQLRQLNGLELLVDSRERSVSMDHSMRSS